MEVNGVDTSKIVIKFDRMANMFTKEQLLESVIRLSEENELLFAIKDAVSNWDHYSSKDACDCMIVKKQKAIIEHEKFQYEHYGKSSEELKASKPHWLKD